MPGTVERSTDRPGLHYVHGLSYTAQERLVGGFVLLALAILFVLLIVSRDVTGLFQETVTFHAFMRNAQGISTDTKVMISGVEVGSVASFDVADDNTIEVELDVLERFRDLVRQDSRASLNKLSVLGRANIQISAGHPNRPVLPDGARIPVDEPLSLDEIFANVIPSLRNANATIERLNRITSAMDPEEIRSITANMVAVSENLNRLSGQLAEGRGAVGTMLFDEGFEESLVRSMGSLERSLAETEQRLADLEPVFSAAGDLTERSNEALEALPRLLSETTRLVEQTNATIGTVNKEMQRFPDLVVRTRRLMDQMDSTLGAVQGTWPISRSLPPPREPEMIEVEPPDE